MKARDFPAVVLLVAGTALTGIILGIAAICPAESVRESSGTHQALNADSVETAKLKKRAWIHASLGRYNRAISDVTKAIRINPEDAESYFMRYRFRQYLDSEPFGRDAVMDLRYAADLGHKEARLILRSHVDY